MLLEELENRGGAAYLTGLDDRLFVTLLAAAMSGEHEVKHTGKVGSRPGPQASAREGRCNPQASPHSKRVTRPSDQGPHHRRRHPEQAPLSFALPTETGTLVTGDYSIRAWSGSWPSSARARTTWWAASRTANGRGFERELSRGRGFGLLCRGGGERPGRPGRGRLPQPDESQGGGPKPPWLFPYDTTCRYSFARQGLCRPSVESLLLKYVAELEKRTSAMVKEGLRCL